MNCRIATRTLSILFCILSLLGAIIGQTNNEQNTTRTINWNLDDWQSLDLGEFVITVPPGVAAKSGGCEGCVRFAGLPDDIVMLGSLHPPTGRPIDSDRSSPGWKEQIIEIDGRKVWLWGYRDPDSRNGLRFKYGLNTDYVKPWRSSSSAEWGMSLQIWSESEQEKLAETIFKSIRFPANQ